jgi:HK97 gp10 family phage protein
MAASATFTVTDARAPRHAVSKNVADIASGVAARAASNTPRRTGRMAASWRTVPGQDHGTTLVINTAEYARFVEYGTRHMRASAPLGRALAGAR